MRRCPAVMLAANRTPKVIGRIIFLISSIKTINLIRNTGVPVGTKCLKNLPKLVLRVSMKSLIQTKLLAEKVKEIRPVLVKM